MPEHDDALDALGASRRTFVKRLVVGTAFAAPVVSSFSMNGVNTVFAQDSRVSGDPDVQDTSVTQVPPTTAPPATTTPPTTTIVTNV